MIIDNDMRNSSSTLSTVLCTSFMIIQTVSFPMSDNFALNLRTSKT